MGSMPEPFNYSSLKESLKVSTAEVLLPSDGEEYEKSIARWSESCTKRAAAVVKPATAEDVSAILAQVRSHQLPLAVRGGGHSTSGASSIKNGLVIDLSKMRKVTVDPEAKTIRAEGGCLWVDVDEEAAKYGLATPGGTVNHTGVGGLTLGGGYGYLSAKYGLVLDNLLSVEIVLASGEKVTASESTNPDLFWAVRGAGQNFGVVTAFTFQGYEQKNAVFAGPLMFLPDKLPSVVDFMNKLHATNDGNQVMIVGFSAPPPANAPVILCQLFYNGSEEDAKAFYADLFALGPIANMTGMIPYEKLNSLLNFAAGFDGRKQAGGGAYKAPLEVKLMTDIYTEFMAFITSHERMNESVILFEHIPYKKIFELPNDKMSFSNRGDYYNIGTMFKWFDPSLDEEVRAFSRQILRKVSESSAADRSKDGGVGQYANYANVDVEANELFGANTKRLEELKQKYDPENLFRNGLRLVPRPLVVVH